MKLLHKKQSSHLCLFLSSLSILCSLSSLSTRRRCRSVARDSWCWRYEDDRRPPRAGLKGQDGNICTIVMPHIESNICSASGAGPRAVSTLNSAHVSHTGARLFMRLHRNMRLSIWLRSSADTCWRAAPLTWSWWGYSVCSRGTWHSHSWVTERVKKKKMTDWTSLTQLHDTYIAWLPWNWGQNENDTLLHNRKFCWCNTEVTLVNNC